jgi:hypothetical protein
VTQEVKSKLTHYPIAVDFPSHPIANGTLDTTMRHPTS